MNSDWKIEYEGWDPKDHPLQEALCTLGNGFFATRAALEFCKGNDYNYPGTYLAGGYNRRKSEIQGRVIENEDLVNWPNWLYLTFKIGKSGWFSPEDVNVLEFTTSINIYEGILERKIRFKDEKNRLTTLVSKRIVSMRDCHVGAIQWTLIPENWSETMTLRSAIDGDVINNNVARYRELNQDHIEVIDKKELSDNSICLISRTKQSMTLMAQAAKTNIYIADSDQKIKQDVVNHQGLIGGDFKIACNENVAVRIEKLVSVYTSKDFAISDPLTEAVTKISRLSSFAEIESKHKMSWSQIWKYNDIDINSNFEDQVVLRLHIFHLYQTVSKNSIGYDVGIPARGWHGEAYRGHIFWDELYILPFINLHQPELARSLLMYRYRRLPEAYQAAKESGLRGALFPWQSGSNGREETQKIHLNPKSGRWLPDVSHLQYHINAAVASNVWHHFQTTGDMDFLISHGAEIIIATALFWSSIAHFNPERNRYEIHKVMGPDEYHTHYPGSDDPGLNNNAYTNIMAVWTMQRALDLLTTILDESCCEDLAEKIGFNAEDLRKWEDITQKMYIPFNKENILMQFEGYEKLKELDWYYYHSKYGDNLRLDRILESENDSPNHYQASKQADALMLFYLFSAAELEQIMRKLNYDFDPESIPDIIDYYEKRTAHGSTLSQVIHAWVYARSHRELSWKSFKSALMSDFKDIQGGTTHEGIHLGAMAGTMDLVQRCYSGLDIRDNVIWLEPKLPKDIKSMKFYIHFRSHWIHLTIDHDKIKIEFDKGWGFPVRIHINNKEYVFKKNDTKELSY
jgi:trehalose/maltose hydrolase-like predicted phosphorylase